jgi:hypothetical protein
MQDTVRGKLAGLQVEAAALTRQGLQLQRDLCAAREAVTSAQATTG